MNKIKHYFLLLVLFSLSSSVFAQNTLCDSNSRYTNYEWIDSISINDSEYSSGNNGGYFEHEGVMPTLSPGENTVRLTPGFRYGSYTEHWQAWIDFNMDDQLSEDEIVLAHSGREPHSMTITLPLDIEPNITNMRFVMRYGGTPTPCGAYTYGETEDFLISIEGELPEPSLPYHLTLNSDFVVWRNGDIGDEVTWVVEMDGDIVLRRRAASELAYKYFRNFAGEHFKVWVTESGDVTNEAISNIVEYSPGVSDRYQLNLSYDFELNRSGSLGDSVQWVIEKDKEIVLQRNAADELSYTYFSNTLQSSFRVWLQEFIDGEYKRVSNIIEYEVGKTEFDITVDQLRVVRRDGHLGDNAQWVVVEDGNIVLERNASDELLYTYFNNKPGSNYRVWLQMFIDGEYKIVSNVVEYSVPLNTPYSLELSSTHKLTRSGSIGDPVTWYIFEDGNLVLGRIARNELSFSYWNHKRGKTYHAFVGQTINGYYQPVSNIVSYTIP